MPGPDPDGLPAAEGVDIFRIAEGVLVAPRGVDVEDADRGDPPPVVATPES